MSQVTISVKAAWRQLRNEGVTEVVYHTVRLWAIELFGPGVREISVNRDPLHPERLSQLEMLRSHAQLMAKGKGTQVKRNASSKIAVLKVISGAHEPIRGSWLIDIADQYNAASRSTLNRRGVRATGRYSKQQAREFICGGITA